MKSNILFLFAAVFFLAGCQTAPEVKHQTKTKTDKNGYTYEYVTNDPVNARIYTLDNGLKVFLSNYEEEPKITTRIAFNTGGANDPADVTGLAHYLEHLLFKGTSSFGTIDYESEKPLLDEIERLFEEYRTITDEEERKIHYAKIDSVSQAASKFAVPNEYDKLISMIGGSGTNAYTSDDQTVYINTIPANELERWLNIEQYRFREFVPRLFHTELETVYEEKNMSLDNDYRKVFEKLYELIYPGHPYGKQSVLGTVDHLKNPSITAIREYFDKYYVPNNAAISMSGDLDYESSIQLIDEYFGDWENREVAHPEFTEVETLTENKSAEVYGPDQEFMYMAYVLPRDEKSKRIATMLDMVMYNNEVGLIDLNLIQNQKVLRAGCYVSNQKHSSNMMFYGYAREGQTPEEVKDLLLAQIDSLKSGSFDEEILDAIITDFEVSEIRRLQSNYARASAYVSLFRDGGDWIDAVTRIDSLRMITKEDIVNFADEHLNNYAVVYKRTGEDTTVQQVEKPQITEIEINRDTNSVFYTELKNQKPPRIEPVFIDYEKDIEKAELSGKIPVIYTPNEENELFSLYYKLDMGTMADDRLGVAVKLLEYLGTDSLTSEQLKFEMYKLGCNYFVYSGDETVYIGLSGLEKNLPQALDLFEHLVFNAVPDDGKLGEVVKDILKDRENDKKSKFMISYLGLGNYAKYGPESPFTDKLNQEELESLKAADLTDKIRDMLNYEHRVMYYGQMSLSEVTSLLEEKHHIADEMKPLKENKKYPYWQNEQNEVFWTHYDMVQTDLSLVNINEEFDRDLLPVIRLYNSYFSGNMGSIVFQELREGKALAYSAYARFSYPYLPDEPFTFNAFIGTQADKLPDALPAMTAIIHEPPVSENAFENSRESLLASIESQRITKTGLLFNYESARKMGYEQDMRKPIYEFAQTATLQDVLDFQEAYIKGRKFRLMVMGDKEKINFDALKKYGPVKEVTLEELFGE